jgi:starch phosphorylase
MAKTMMIFFLQPMMRKMALSGAVNGYIYEAIVPKDRPFEHYTPRIVPHHVYANIPSEEIHIKWYR